MNVSEQLNDTSKFSNCIHSRENLLEKLPVIFIKLNASLLKIRKIFVALRAFCGRYFPATNLIGVMFLEHLKISVTKLSEW